jgi:hypothetical protein
MTMGTKAWRGRFGMGIPLVAALGLALSFAPGWFAVSRTANEHEMLLAFFAANLGEAALCGRISWAAHQRYSVLFGGGGASYARSDCYEQVARARHDAGVCWRVRPLVDFDPQSSGYSALACRRRTLAAAPSNAEGSDEMLVHTLTQLGYDIDQLHSEGPTPPAIQDRDVYVALAKNAAVLARARDLLTHAAALRSDDLSYIAQLAAVGTPDANLCAVIPAGETLRPIEAPFRDWCFYTVAFDTQDTRVCDRMTPATAERKVQDAIAAGVRPQIAEQLGLHSDCIRSGQRVGPSLHYGPEVPPDARQTERLLAALGVTKPSAHDWPATEIAAFFRQFVFALAPGNPPDPRRDAARAKLVQKLLVYNDAAIYGRARGD